MNRFVSKLTGNGLVLALLVFIVASNAGCPVVQSKECSKFIKCVAYIDELRGTDSSGAGYEDSYGETGTCWTDAETAALCTTTCAGATTTLARSLTAAGDDTGDCG